MGCSSGFGGIGFGANGATGCANYSLLGEGINTYLNRPAGGQLLFRENNATEMVLASGRQFGYRHGSAFQSLNGSEQQHLPPGIFQDSSTFGTWIELNNISTGGSGPSFRRARATREGAGNLAITNFTGTSNINLEGNVKVNSLSVNSDTPMSSQPAHELLHHFRRQHVQRSGAMWVRHRRFLGHLRARLQHPDNPFQRERIFCTDEAVSRFIEV